MIRNFKGGEESGVKYTSTLPVALFEVCPGVSYLPAFHWDSYRSSGLSQLEKKPQAKQHGYS